MKVFSEYDPIMDESDIPEFISKDDLLDVRKIAIYDLNGNCIA